MKAIVQDAYGSADVLELRDVDRPEIGDDEVLVRVHAAGVDRGAWHLMTGLPYLMRLVGFGLRAPKNPVPGHGRRRASSRRSAADVTRFQPGDEVFGIGKGSFAEYAAAPRGQARAQAGEPHLRAGGGGRPSPALHRPAGPARRRAAAAGPEGADHRRVGRRRHATPCRSPRRSAPRSPACAARRRSTWSARSAPTTSSTTPATTSPTGEQRYDLILDIGGNASLSRLRRALTPTGTLVIVGGEGGGRWLGGSDRQIRALRAVAVREPEAGHVHRHARTTRTCSSSRSSSRPARSRRSSTGRYPLSEVPEAIRLPRGGARPRQGRHHRVRRRAGSGVRREAAAPGRRPGARSARRCRAGRRCRRPAGAR